MSHSLLPVHSSSAIISLDIRFESILEEFTMNYNANLTFWLHIDSFHQLVPLPANLEMPSWPANLTK